MRVYLSGAIEYAPDHGRAWRGAVTPLLLSLGLEVYDPALDEKKNLSSEEVEHFRKWKSTDLPRFQETLRKIIDYDLDRIEHQTDCIVCWWDEYAQGGAGTQAELSVAYRRKMPVYLITSLPAEQVSGWILGCSSEVFAGFDQFADFIRTKQHLTAKV